jgi:hypothetical protein
MEKVHNMTYFGPPRLTVHRESATGRAYNLADVARTYLSLYCPLAAPRWRLDLRKWPR